MLLIVDKITGYTCKDPFIRVNEREKIPFYLFDNKDRVRKGFNLPPGIYTTDNTLVKQDVPFEYKLPKLPKPERHLEVPHNLKIEFGDNVNKCTVYPNIAGVCYIFMDNSFKDAPSFVTKFILFHEIGHYMYGGKDQLTDPKGFEESESYCDTFAGRELLKRGYNPTQVALANRSTLNSEFRHKCCLETMKKVKQK